MSAGIPPNYGQQAPMSPEQFAAITQAQQQASNGTQQNTPPMAQSQFNFSEFARSNGLDVSQFPGGEPAMAQALFKAAQGYMDNKGQVSQMEQKLQMAQQSAAQNNLQSTGPAAGNPVVGQPAAAPNVDQWQHLLVEKEGKIFPAEGASVPWDVVQAAQTQFEQRRTNIESIMKDPMSVIREHAGGDWLKEQVSTQFKELHEKQQQEVEIDTWFNKNRNSLYSTDAEGNQVPLHTVERLSEIADKYREQGMLPKHIFHAATRDLEHEMLQTEVEHMAQTHFEKQQQQLNEQQWGNQQPQQDYMQQALAAVPQQQQYQQPYNPQPQHPSQQGRPADTFWPSTDWNNQNVAPQQYAQDQMTAPQSPQQTFLDRNVGAPSGDVHPGAMQTMSRDSAPGSAAELQSADFVATDPETLARDAATESGFMNGA